MKYLDQSNISNAFVSGMYSAAVHNLSLMKCLSYLKHGKADLSLYENQLNIMTTCWTVGYLIGEIPSNLMLTRFRPSIWIPPMELIWCVLTFALSRCQTANQIYGLRFVIGRRFHCCMTLPPVNAV